VFYVWVDTKVFWNRQESR